MSAKPSTTVARTLECGHVRFYLVRHAPKTGDVVYCTSCDTGRYVGDSPLKGARYLEDDFWTTPTANRNVYHGECIECDYKEHDVVGWNNLRDNMYRHYLAKHSGRERSVFDDLRRMMTDDVTEPPF